MFKNAVGFFNSWSNVSTLWASSVTDGWVEELPLFIEDFSRHFHFLSCDPQQNEKNRKYEY